MDELGAIRVFTRVAQSGSFSEAGRLMGISTSYVARLVDSLERQLDVRLLNRTTRQLVLTEAGQRFLEDATRIVQLVEHARREATAYQEGVRGLIRVHCSTSAGSAVIVPALPQFLAKHPDVVVDLSLTDQRVDIVHERIDVAIWRGTLEDSHLVGRRLGSSRRVLCGSPEYFARHGKPSVPADLAEHNCLVFSARGYSNEWIFEKEGEAIRISVAGNLKTDSAGALLTSTLNGVGLTVLAEWIARESCRQGRLEVALTEYDVRPADTDASLYLLYPHRSPPPKVVAFIEFVLTLFGREGEGLSP